MPNTLRQFSEEENTREKGNTMTKNIEYTERGIAVPPEIMDDLTRREFLIGAGLIALVPACGSGEEESSPSGETRTIEHSLGTTEVPVSPERVVVVDRGATLPNLLVLGIEPIAAGTGSFTQREFPNVPRDFDEDLESVGILDFSGEEINLESIAALNPDLLIGQDSFIESVYEELSQIAATVASKQRAEDFRPELRFLAEVFGREERAETLIADFDRRVEEAADRFGDLGTVTVASVFPGEIRVFSPDSLTGGLISDFGAAIVPDTETFSGGEVVVGVIVGLSEEAIPSLDGDILILLQNLTSQEETDYIAELESRPIWRNLPAVRNERVFVLDVQLAAGNGGLPGLQATLNELIEFFTRNGS